MGSHTFLIWQVSLERDAVEVRDQIRSIVKRIESSYPGAIYYEEKSHMSLGARMLLWQVRQILAARLHASTVRRGYV